MIARDPLASASPIAVLRALTALIRSVVMYPRGHVVIGQTVGDLKAAIERTAGDRELLRIEILGGVAHLLGQPFRTESRANADIVSEWSSMPIHCIEVARDIGEDELLALGEILSRFVASTGEAVESAARALEDAQLTRARLTKLVPLQVQLHTFDWPDAPTEVAAESYREALSLARDTIGSAFGGAKLDLGGIEDLLSQVSDQLLQDSVAMAEIMAIKEYENHTFCHSVNVAALSIMLARRVGFRDSALAVVGEAALLHDLGKRQIPVDILKKPGQLSRRERRIVERHPVFGAEILATTEGLASLTPTVALEHHRHFSGGGGYPDLDGAAPHDLSQVVAVADIYEALTGARPYREPLLPDQACLILARMAGANLNPALVRAFVSMVSFFPVGSIVRTSLGEIGRVIRVHDNDPLHPEIELLEDRTLESTGVVVDTSERDSTGVHVRHIDEALRNGPRVDEESFGLP